MSEIRTLKRILHAEDDPDIQLIVRNVLEFVGKFEVKTCSNGEDAINSIANFKPDLILLDVMMPKMDGITAFQHMRIMPEAEGIPVVFMTAKAQYHEIEKYKETGVSGIIIKPFESMELCNTLTKLWGKHHES